MVAADVPA